MRAARRTTAAPAIAPAATPAAARPTGPPTDSAPAETMPSVFAPAATSGRPGNDPATAAGVGGVAESGGGETASTTT
ncbi:hypothetical protein GCM10022245_23440 [Streptomyces mayteni]